MMAHCVNSHDIVDYKIVFEMKLVFIPYSVKYGKRGYSLPENCDAGVIFTELMH